MHFWEGHFKMGERGKKKTKATYYAADFTKKKTKTKKPVVSQGAKWSHLFWLSLPNIVLIQEIVI